MRQNRRTNAFTLIELLTVIAIIGVLAALLFPAIKSALTKAETSKAQAAVTGLSTAFRSYYTEYGRWPIADPVAKHTYIVDANLVAMLQGVNPTVPPVPLGPTEPPFGIPFNQVSGATIQGNPRGIHFLDFKQADLDGSGNFVDPWKVPYYCRFDVSYANTVADPFTGGSVLVTNFSTGFLVWSSGPDGQYDNNGDSPSPSTLNKDNAKSW
jgi:prepilin-type N-terminal cleavage/methylation domain-containing protein